MGDVLGLIEKAQKNVDEKKARELERKLRENDFTLEDFRDQLQQIRKMGSIEQLMGMLPKVGPFAKLPRTRRSTRSSSSPPRPSSIR
jgi:signal recognition particle subunit SRP54